MGLDLDTLGICLQDDCKTSGKGERHQFCPATDLLDESGIDPNSPCDLCGHAAIFHFTFPTSTPFTQPDLPSTSAPTSSSSFPTPPQNPSSSSSGKPESHSKTHEAMGKSRQSKYQGNAWTEMAKKRTEAQAGGLFSLGGSSSFDPSAKHREQAAAQKGSDHRRDRKRNRKKGTSGKEKATTPTSAASKKAKTKAVTFTIVLMPPTSLIHKQPQSMCAKPDPSRFQDLDDAMFVREATVQDDEDAVAIDQTIVKLFSHIPALIAHDRAVMRNIHDKRTRGWTPLRVITRGKGRLGRLQPLDEILPVTLQSLLRASSNTNIRNIKGYPNILFIGVSSGGQDIPYSGTGALDLAREDDDDNSSSDESRSGGNMGDGDVDDVGSDSNKKAEDGTAPNNDDKLSESSDPPAAFNETPSYDTSHSDSLDLDEIDPGTVDNEFNHGSSTLPRSHVLLIRSLHNMHAPSGPAIWWPLNAPTSNEFSSAIKACDYLDFTIEFWSGPAMNTADVWTKAGEGLIKSLDFIRILDLRLLDLQLLISEVGDDERGHILEAILPEIAFGEYGLGRIVPSLSILYQLVASLPPSMATLQAERRARLLRFSMALRRLVLCFKENTSRTLYDPLSFRLLGLEIEKAMKGKKLFDATIEQWERLLITKLSFSTASPEEIKEALDEDFGHSSDPSLIWPSALRGGSFGLPFFFSLVIAPFLDQFPVDHEHFSAFFAIFDVFAQALTVKIQRFFESGKGRASSKTPDDTTKKDKRKRSETDNAPDSVPSDGASGKEPPPLRRSGRKCACTEAEESTEQAEGYGEKSGGSGSAKNMPSKTPPLFNPSASDDETDFNMQDFIDELEKENFDLRKDWDEHERQKKDSREFAGLFNEEPATAEQPSFTSPMSPMSPSPPTDAESSSEPDIEVVSPPSTPWPSKPKKQDSEEIVEARLRREEAELKAARKLQDILVWNVLVAKILDNFEHPVSEIRNSLVQGIKSKSPREQFYALQRAYHPDKNTKNRVARTGHWAAVCEEIAKALNLRAPHRRRS